MVSAMRIAHFAMVAGAALFLALPAHAQEQVGGACTVDTDCRQGCCGSEMANPVCLDKGLLGPGDACQTQDGCDCEIGLCTNLFCVTGSPVPTPTDTVCDVDTECSSGCCATELTNPICVPKSTVPADEACSTLDGCDCMVGLCDDGFCCAVETTPAPTPTACTDGTSVCGDPHMQGLRGQKIDWSGVDGGWYCMVTDGDANLHVNLRLTAPLPDDFPDRQLITGLSVISEGHSLVIEVKNPYDVRTNGCPGGISPCLADGGLRAIVDGEEVKSILRFARDQYVADGIAVSASNLPVECRQFGGDRIWARMYDEMLQGKRVLTVKESFEDWILRFDHMAAPGWCREYIAQHGLDHVQSNYAVLKVVTPSATVRLNVGTNYQGSGELDWDGRVLPDMEFWQMDVGLEGLSLESQSLSGILGETARPVLDKDGRPVMEGYEAFRGTVQDYRVSGALGTDFALLNKH